MNAAKVLWGLILLVGFAATQLYGVPGGLSEANAWIAWSIIIFVLTWVVGRTLKPQPDKAASGAWMTLMIFGLILSLVIAGTAMQGTSWVPLWWLMSLWFLVLGAAKFATMGQKDPAVMAVSVVYLFSALFVAGWGANYWLIGGIVFGLPAIIHGLMKD
ncbi:MAG: hypothetical protein HYW25_03020 [Candidatus Aenigmarchaeota archaeon]|nr:hypothetical protein [Candidatus Aenigmarchaeota archaeon]